MTPMPITLQQFYAGSAPNLPPAADGPITWLSYEKDGTTYHLTQEGLPTEELLDRVSTLSTRFGVIFSVKVIEVSAPNPTTSPDDTLYPSKEAAKRLGVSYDTLTAWYQKGLIKPTLDTPQFKAYTQADLDNRTPPKPARRPTKVEQKENNK